MYIRIVGVILLICVSCSKKEGYDVGLDTHKIEYEKISTLKENIFLIGNIESFDIINDEHFVVTTSKPFTIIIYDRNGNQIKKIGELGRGPFEYQKPNMISVYNNKIFVWDDNQLKLMVYNDQGIILNEYSDFKVAIKSFKVIKNKVCFYFGGGYSGMVGIYDLIKGEFVFKGGEVTEEHLLLNLNKGAGGMTMFNEGLIYIAADELSLRFLSFSDYKEKTLVSLYDESFKVENVRNSRNMINSSRSKTIKYLMENSYVTGLFSTNNNVFIKAEVGKFKKFNKKSNDNSDRFQKFYVLNKNFELIKVVKAKHDFNESNMLFTMYNDEIYRLTLNTFNNNFNFELSKLKFKKLN